MKIVLPVDGSEYTKRMLAYIAAHDELLSPGCEYVAFTVVPPVPPHAASFIDRKTLESYYREEAEQVLRPIEAFAQQQRWGLRTAHGHGPAAETIATFVNAEKPDLVIMGTHGHSALGNLVLGSVASGVLARTKLPVLLVR